MWSKNYDAVGMPLLCGLDGCGNATALARKLTASLRFLLLISRRCFD